MKVIQFSGKNGAVKNQFIIEGVDEGFFPDGTQHETGRYFQSYRSLIIFKEYSGKVFLDRGTWDYSKTTGKYRNQFLGETKKETEAKIKSGKYTLVDMN